MRRRTALTAVVATGVVILLGSYVIYTRSVVRELQREAVRSSRMFALIYSGVQDTGTSETSAYAVLTQLAAQISEAGVPLVLTTRDGTVTASENVPESVQDNADAMRAYLGRLDAENPPVVEPTTGQTLHFGSTQLVRGLRVVPAAQAVLLALLLIGAAVMLRTYGRAERDRVWAGMARESAHQIGTPLSSLHGWMEVLRDRAGDPLVDSAIESMRADVDRLERVAHRFERIGRPPKLESIDVAPMVERVVQYFRSRVPTRTTPVHLVIDVHGNGLTIPGDRVLLEWVLEALIKNAIDALAGTGGTISVGAESLPGGRVRIRVADDGPGVPPALRDRIFDAGFSTKERGWGIGLALTRRIVEENHRGRLTLASTAKGAAFDVILPA
jgi:signal transduction histidine kinase